VLKSLDKDMAAAEKDGDWRRRRQERGAEGQLFHCVLKDPFLLDFGASQPDDAFQKSWCESRSRFHCVGRKSG
jgi:hypothetical protein